MLRWSRRATVGTWLSAAVLTLACAAPPNKEIADAQAALKAASAAGAEQYAPETYRSASEAYRLANEAVMSGDYRLALNRALESREQAQTAARESADARNRTRDDVQRTMVDVVSLLSEANSQIEEAERAGVSRTIVRDARRTVARLNDDVQKAGAAMKRSDYGSAGPLLASVEQRLEQVVEMIDKAVTAQSQKRRR